MARTAKLYASPTSPRHPDGLFSVGICATSAKVPRRSPRSSAAANYPHFRLPPLPAAAVAIGAPASDSRGVPLIATDREIRAAVRSGARSFLVGFARRHRLEGLPAGQAAAQALRDMAHRAIGEALGIPELARAGRKRLAPAGGGGGRKRPAERKRRATAAAREPDRDGDRARRLKSYLDGNGPDPGPRRK